ncbi:hypothetical protein ZIOFF_050088 [Zingiber officinale]|uniref:CCHC-type domain-containing protein n=1 Tax=Zingiber officinale TaxID=94328 RepID=A0A8J5KR43_ZINOF|nr:hypothetical protein ZIOFF_050088 [Zingiber officinale]
MYPQMPLRHQNTPPPLNASKQVLAGLAHLLRQNADISQAMRTEMPYEKIRKMGPPEFTSSTDPFIAEGWVRSLETIFIYMRLEDVAKVSYDVFQLKEDVALWWEGAERTVNMETLNGEEFKKIFYDKDVLMSHPADYAATLKRAFRSKKTLRDLQAEAQRKRPSYSQPQSQVKKQFTGPPRPQGKEKLYSSGKPRGQQALKSAMQREKPTCQTCGRQHAGKCFLGAGVCYKCKQSSHLSFDCPQLRGPATGRVYVMKTEEANLDTTLITGRVLVLGVATEALFDLGATHSFILHAFVRRKGIAQEGLTESLLVTIPSGEELSTTSIVRNLEMVLQGHTMHADLIVFPMPEFNIILGMGWLSMNKAVIDFQCRTVQLSPPGGEPFTFVAAKNSRKPRLISFLQARKVIDNGCPSFLGSITVTTVQDGPSITDVELRELEGRLAEEIKCRDRAERKLKKAMKKLESTKVLDGNNQMAMPLSSVSSSSSQCLSGLANADMLQDVKMRPCSLGSKDLVRDDDASGSSVGESVRDGNKLALVPVGDQLDLQVREVDDIDDNVQGVLMALRNAKEQLIRSLRMRADIYSSRDYLAYQRIKLL